MQGAPSLVNTQGAFRIRSRSPGKKVNSESPCAPRSLPERRTERKGGKRKKKKKKNDMGRPSFSERGP